MDRHLLEIKNRGSFLFPFERYPTKDETGNFYVSCHYHPEIEILYMTKGTLTLFIDGVSYVISPGTIVFFNREEIHALHSNGKDTSYDAFVFPLEFLSFQSMDYCQQNFLLPLMQKKLLFPRFLTKSDTCYGPVQDELTGLSELHTRFPEGYQLTTKARLYQILSILIADGRLISMDDSPRVGQMNNKRLSAMRQMISYIQNHYTEKISLQEIAANFYMTPNYFCKYFKDSFSLPFTVYLNQVRVERACILLTDTDLSILEISIQSGFDNLSYFIRTFKKRNGITPSQYRKVVSRSDQT